MLTSTTRNSGFKKKKKKKFWFGRFEVKSLYLFSKVLEILLVDTLSVEYHYQLPLQATFEFVPRIFYITWRQVSFILVLWLYKEEPRR